MFSFPCLSKLRSTSRPKRKCKQERTSWKSIINPNKNTMANQQSQRYSYCMLVCWYIAFGALHECFHVAAAMLAVGHDAWAGSSAVSKFFQIVLDRCVVLQVGELCEDFVRHSGWIGSVLLAVVLNMGTKNDLAYRVQRWASLVTTVEAIWTDLLQISSLLPFSRESHNLPTSATAFFCGNFGLILLHQAWFADREGDDSALDILEKMVQVTMMRGAQSGGIVSFYPKRTSTTGDSANSTTFQAIRTRVVNRKRTDLSKWLRQKTHRDHNTLGRSLSLRRPAQGEALFYAGHTRFATSSKASMEGTHPQRWTVPTSCKVYLDWKSSKAVPHEVLVENYITHNGDFDFYEIYGHGIVDIESLQHWLVKVTQSPMPAIVDSCAVAGMVDVLKTRGFFSLSARYACSLGQDTMSRLLWDSKLQFPSRKDFDNIGKVFEVILSDLMQSTTLETIGDSSNKREKFARLVADKLVACRETLIPDALMRFILSVEDETSSTVLAFCLCTVHAFFDNDLFWATKTFLENARGSFGLCVTSSLDAHRQICLAARGQTMSIAFYPRKGIVCYGSEAAAVKAGMNTDFPGDVDTIGQSTSQTDNDVLRLDLDDLGGEVVLLDWAHPRVHQVPSVSTPNQHLSSHSFMNGAIQATIYQQSKAAKHDRQIVHRMTQLSRNRLIKMLRTEPKDPVLADIQDIPTICKSIQDEWRSDKASVSLNRLSAYNLSRCLRTKLEVRAAGLASSRTIDILLTGCEVSLWLAEQFASDLQKAFPRLGILALSSNKLLGLYGQEIAIPSLGFPYSPENCDLHDAVVIIVSHSGGTFAPLSCSNLLQSTTKNIFVVTSEWDTQIAKQLRAMDVDEHKDLFASRIFSTEVGMRPAEPCSVSVAATHQLLTNLFEYISVLFLSDQRYRRASGATISEQDLQVLEKCNRDNIAALTELVGTIDDQRTKHTKSQAESQLREAGDVWSEHILENAKAYILSCIYIFGTVCSGYPIFHAIAYSAGLDFSSDWKFLIRALDAAVYFWLPQINITLIRLCQGRSLRHRMVGRTVVIGDIPWVAQAAEAFLSKLFACSYSIAGLNVLSGNPSDHFVHRHTHRVVRGSLVICGRPDGRLTSLATAEAAVCLSVNQASSIQSFGGTCESITIGHNPFKLPLSARGIFLKRKRPLFLCERMLVEQDVKLEGPREHAHRAEKTSSVVERILQCFRLQSFQSSRRAHKFEVDLSLSRHNDSSVNPRVHKKRSATALIGAYMNFEDDGKVPESDTRGDKMSVNEIVESAILKQKWSDRVRKLFQAFDMDGDGFISEREFLASSYRLKAGVGTEELVSLFRFADTDSSGSIDYGEFQSLYAEIEEDIKLPPTHRNETGLIQVDPSDEKYFGETVRQYNTGKTGAKDVDFLVARSQENAMQLYETRVASLQRFVAMTVLFHQMGMRVQKFFSTMSLGVLGYRTDRTHSSMRIATTASPVSGADLRERMHQMHLEKKVRHSIHIISKNYLKYQAKKRNPKTIVSASGLPQESKTKDM